jgi:amino-acid N-acetyltransferase
MTENKSDVQTCVLRKASVKDVPAMARLINDYAAKSQMLPRSHHRLYQDIRDFVVAECDGQIIGCGALHVVWEDIAEVRSLAVAPEYRNMGLGRHIVDTVLAEAKALGLPRVFALTYHRGFFERAGFRIVARETLPHKIWGDCIDCPKFPNCDEVALIIDLDEIQPAPSIRFSLARHADQCAEVARSDSGEQSQQDDLTKSERH